MNGLFFTHRPSCFFSLMRAGAHTQTLALRNRQRDNEKCSLNNEASGRLGDSVSQWNCHIQLSACVSCGRARGHSCSVTHSCARRRGSQSEDRRSSSVCESLVSVCCLQLIITNVVQRWIKHWELFWEDVLRHSEGLSVRMGDVEILLAKNHTELGLWGAAEGQYF